MSASWDLISLAVIFRMAVLAYFFLRLRFYRFLPISAYSVSGISSARWNVCIELRLGIEWYLSLANRWSVGWVLDLNNLGLVAIYFCSILTVSTSYATFLGKIFGLISCVFEGDSSRTGEYPFNLYNLFNSDF